MTFRVHEPFCICRNCMASCNHGQADLLMISCPATTLPALWQMATLLAAAWLAAEPLGPTWTLAPFQHRRGACVGPAHPAFPEMLACPPQTLQYAERPMLQAHTHTHTFMQASWQLHCCEWTPVPVDKIQVEFCGASTSACLVAA